MSDSVPSTQGTLRASPRGWLLDGLLLVLVLAVYWPALRGDWTWDDWAMVRDNASLRSPGGLREIWTRPRQFVEYYPVTYTTVWIEYQLFGLRPFGFHVTNILLHGTCAIALRRLLARIGVPGPFVAATVFVVHPVFVESVAWIAELKNVLSGVFFVLSALCFVRLMESEHSAARPAVRGWHLASCLCFALALLSKASTLILPGALLLMCWWIEGRIRRQRLVQIIPFILLMVACAAMTIWMENFRPKLADPVQWTALQRLVVAGQVPWFYLSKLLFPRNLLFIYPNWTPDPSSIVSFLPGAAVVAAFVVLWFMRHAWGRGPFVGWVYFILALAPVMGLINIDYQRLTPVADHFQYLAAMGMIAALVGIGSTSLRRAPRWAWAPAGVLVLLLSVWSFRRAMLFGNPEQLWTQTVRLNSDSWMARLNLAEHLKARKDLPAAVAVLEEALRRSPDNAEVHEHIGHLYSELGQREQATEHFSRGTHGRLPVAMQYSNEALEMENRGDFVAAERLLRRAVAISKGHPDIVANLVNLLATCPDPRVAHPAEAVDLAETLCAAPGQRTASNLLLLGIAYASAGRSDDAMRTLNDAASLARRAGDESALAAVDRLRRQLE